MTAAKKASALSWAVGALILAVGGIVYYYEVHAKKNETTGESEEASK